MNYVLDIDLHAPREAVFTALTTSAGVSRWWTTANTLDDERGKKSLSVDFGQIHKALRIETERIPSDLCWRVVACTLHEWVDTRIVFGISSLAEGGTHLRLEHQGLGPHLECFDSCSAGWKHFMLSLKRYLETGTGMPYPGLH